MPTLAYYPVYVPVYASVYAPVTTWYSIPQPVVYLSQPVPVVYQPVPVVHTWTAPAQAVTTCYSPILAVTSRTASW